MNNNQPMYWIWEEDKGEEIANARLIAAAPDLLEALKYLIALNDAHLNGMGTALKAIAKAEGLNAPRY
jgi:hypothetical protein